MLLLCFIQCYCYPHAMIQFFIFFYSVEEMQASDNQPETDGDAVRKVSYQQDERLPLQTLRLIPISHEFFYFYFYFFRKWFCLSLKAFVRFHKISSRLIAKEWKERLQFSLFIQILEQNGSKNAKQWKKTPVYRQKRVSVCKHNTNT